MDLSHRYDVIVAGGGVAGVAAAVCSARLGARTLLVERYGFLGGLSTAGLVNPFMASKVEGFYSEICERMADLGGMLGRAFDPEAMKFCAQEMVMESGADLLLHAFVEGVTVEDGLLKGLSVRTRTGARRFAAQVVIDATGDADVAAMAGVPFEVGNPEHDGLTQAMTLMFTVGGVDLRKPLMYALNNPDEMRFPKPRSEAEVDTMLEGVISVAGFYREVEEARARGEFPLEQDMVFFISLPTPGHVVVNTTHIVGMNGADSCDLTDAEVEGRRQAIALMRFMRAHVPGFEAAYLAQTAPQVGVRESRRILGEYVFTADDVEAGRKFPDCVLRSAYPVDVHSSRGKGYARDEKPSRRGAPEPGDWYEAPYRCMVPIGVDNLLVAGRCASATHEGQGALRIMPNCMALGQAAGTAAALCTRHGSAPRLLDTYLLRESLLDQGVLI